MKPQSCHLFVGFVLNGLRRRIVVSTSVFALLACVATNVVSEDAAKLGKYVGPPLDDHQVAQLFPAVDASLPSIALWGGLRIVAVEKIDGQNLKNSPSVLRWRTPPGPIDILPGPHTVQFRWNPPPELIMVFGARLKVDPAELSFEARPGRKYLLSGFQESGGYHSPLMSWSGKWSAGIVDLENGQTVAGVPIPTYVPKNQYVPEQYTMYRIKGKGVISGHVPKVTNPSDFVFLVPATPLTEELIERESYSMTIGQSNLAERRVSALVHYNIPMAKAKVKDRDSESPSFSFKNVPPGKYVVFYSFIEVYPETVKSVVTTARVTLDQDQQVLDVICKEKGLMERNEPDTVSEKEADKIQVAKRSQVKGILLEKGTLTPIVTEKIMLCKVDIGKDGKRILSQSVEHTATTDSLGSFQFNSVPCAIYGFRLGGSDVETADGKGTLTFVIDAGDDALDLGKVVAVVKQGTQVKGVLVDKATRKPIVGRQVLFLKLDLQVFSSNERPKVC